MIRIPQLKLHIGHTEEELCLAVRRELRLPNGVPMELRIEKRSLDARKKQELHYVYAVCVLLPEAEEKKVLSRAKGNLQKAVCTEYSFSPTGTRPMSERPVIIGAGPAGLFCAYFLAKYGYRPLILERGEEVEQRRKQVERFWQTGQLSLQSNVQFGEGGAGTFSDGKLNTMVKDTSGRIREVLRVFVRHGAPEEILYLNKPHIGTDFLRNILISMRKQMTEWGAEFRFRSQVTDFDIQSGQRLTGLTINHQERLDCQVAVAAIGHSARDTFELLTQKPLLLERKPFAIGVRVEHPQAMIGQAQYGEQYAKLPAADYKLTYQTAAGRGVYSFCMCPGGFVVNASSEAGHTAVNGMSNHDRAGRNANSALVVTVTPEDFAKEGFTDVLAGMRFQRKWEALAYEQGQGSIPVQLFGDLLRNEKSATIGEIQPDMKGAYTFANLRDCLPDYVTESLVEGIFAFATKIPGFARKDAVLAGVETRTSSPIRIVRDALTLQSPVAGLYPCGEGAGYAGGITSAAVDGIKVFEAIASLYAAK